MSWLMCPDIGHIISNPDQAESGSQHACRSLVEQAADLGGHPWLLSFNGMAEVLGWKKRPPLLPESSRPMILQSWADKCQGMVPRQHYLPFEEVRSMSPEQFVELLLELKVVII